MDKNRIPRDFFQLTIEDKDLTMFTATDLKLVNKEFGNMVYMALKLKRKVATELLTTYLPTILLLLITFVTTFFDKSLFSDTIAVNLTIMLVMTTIFTSKIEELPPSSNMKMIDIWLIFCLIVPFLEVILRTAIESMMNCNCNICEPTDDRAKTDAETEANSKEVEEDTKGSLPSGHVRRVWVGSASQQVTHWLSKQPKVSVFPITINIF